MPIMNNNQQKTTTEDENIYHEKQHLQRCAIHAVNNLLQAKKYEKKEFDRICQTLSPDAFVNPHKSIFGFGNYDVNVVMCAIQQQGLAVKWFDRRKNVDLIDLSKLYGLIVNYSTTRLFGQLSKHWFAIRRIGDTFYNFDSKYDKPSPFPNEQKMKEELQFMIEKRRAELLLVVENANLDSIMRESTNPQEKLHHTNEENQTKEEENESHT